MIPQPNVCRLREDYAIHSISLASSTTERWWPCYYLKEKLFGCPVSTDFGWIRRGKYDNRLHTTHDSEWWNLVLQSKPSKLLTKQWTRIIVFVSCPENLLKGDRTHHHCWNDVGYSSALQASFRLIKNCHRHTTFTITHSSWQNYQSIITGRMLTACTFADAGGQRVIRVASITYVAQRDRVI